MEKRLTVKKKGDKKVLFEQEMLEDNIITVGNNPTATLELTGNMIAPEQFVVVTQNNQILLMNRADGTKVNGEDLGLGGQVALEIGDEIEIGDYTLIYQDLELNGSAEKKMPSELDTDEMIDISESESNLDNTSLQKDDFENSDIEITTEKESKIEEKSDKDFSDVLSNLKKEESFYFQIKDSQNILEKVNFDNEEIWIGVRFDECVVHENKEDFDEVYAQVKKDWSGAVIYPTGNERLFLNEQELNEPARLKNDDEIILFDSFEEENYLTSITFHEPIALLVLNSILPEDLPEPVSLDNKKQISHTDDDSLEEAENSTKVLSNQKETNSIVQKSKILGYFTPLEILIMTIGTLVTAMIIFFLLELV